MSILKSDITPALINQIIENSLCFNLNVWHVDHPTHQIDWRVVAIYVRSLNFISMLFLSREFGSDRNPFSHTKESQLKVCLKGPFWPVFDTLKDSVRL